MTREEIILAIEDAEYAAEERLRKALWLEHNLYPYQAEAALTQALAESVRAANLRTQLAALPTTEEFARAEQTT